MSTYIGGRIIPKHAGTWDEQAEYEVLSIVLDEESGDSYISRKAVPSGTALDDEEYWMLFSLYSAQVAEAVELVDEVQERMDVIEERLDANVAASTDNDADYAAEVVDARVDSTGETCSSLGSAIRSISEGMQTKVNPNSTTTVVNYDNTASISVDGYVCDCTLYYEGQGYAGVFARFFGTYDDCKEKKYRIIIIGTGEAEMEAIVTNRGGAWGGGTTGSFSLCTVSLTADNGYMAAVDVDCSEDTWSEFAASYTMANGLYFCLRCMSMTATVDTAFSMYAYELDSGSRSTWKYADGADDITLLGHEMKSARGDYATLSERLSEQEDTLGQLSEGQITDMEERLDALEEIGNEVTDAHTDSRGTVYDTLSDRLSVLDIVSYPKLSVSGLIAPRDNKAGTLGTGDMSAEKVNNNAVFGFDYTAYTTEYDTYEWSSLNFSFSISNAVLSALSDRSTLYLDFGIADVDGDDSHDGESMTIGIFLNSYPAWGTPVNPMVTFSARIGKRTLVKLDEEMVENVLATELPLYIVFYGDYLNTDAIADLDKICITAAVVDAEGRNAYVSDFGWCDFTDQAEYAEKAGSAETADSADYASEAGTAATAENAASAEKADTAEYAESADYADNFFLNSPEDLLNEDGLRYSEGMDTLDIPDPPYSFSYSFQSIAEVYGAELVGSGFEQYLSFEMELNASSGQPSNQGYVKKLNGMLSFDDMFQKFQDGYADCCICTIEDTNYPEESSNGTYVQRLLISYYGSSANNKVLVSASQALTKTVLAGKTLYLWRFSLDEDTISSLAEEIEAGTFKISWFGIWNTRKYTGDDPVSWNPIWYWQDYAFTDGSYSDDEVASYFESKYIYWASYVNHRKLKDKIEALEEWQGTLEESLSTLDDVLDSAEETAAAIQELTETVSELQNTTGGIVCWGDSLTAQGGWTTTLASLSGRTVYNAGTGGENVLTIMARQGADVMMVNDITIPAECEAVTIAARADAAGITTALGNTVTPLLQGGTGHVNPVMIGDIEGKLAWTGSSYSDTTGEWTFTRSTAGDEVVITRPTAIRTAYDRNRNGEDDIMVIFMGQNGGYDSDNSVLIQMHKLMIDHFKGKEYVILGLSSGTEESRAEYEAAMKEEFGRRFISLREYLAHPIYDTDGETIISCYGLDDAGLDATDDDLEAIAEGKVPSTLLSDSVHYVSDTRTVIGTMLYKKMVELGIL